MPRRKQGSGSLRQRSDGRWEGRAVIGYNEKGLSKTKFELCADNPHQPLTNCT